MARRYYLPSNTSLASSILAARKVEPPRSGCIFVMRSRCARRMSSSLAPSRRPRIERLHGRHVTVGAAAVALRTRHILAPSGMHPIEICFDDLRRLRIGKAAVLPEMRHLDGSEGFQIAAGEETFQHAAANFAGVVVELHFQVLGGDARGLAGRFLRRAPGRAAHAPQQPRPQARPATSRSRWRREKPARRHPPAPLRPRRYAAGGPEHAGWPPCRRA